MYDCVIDISDAYYHVSIHKKSRKYTRFILDGDVYEYLGLPMGLTCSPADIHDKVPNFLTMCVDHQKSPKQNPKLNLVIHD